MEQMLFGQILLNFHLVDQKDLDYCLGVQSQLGGTKPLGEILIEEGKLDEKILKTILTVQKREIDSTTTDLGVDGSELSQRLASGQAIEYLRAAREIGASDLYITSNKIPLVRLHGHLTELPTEPLSPKACHDALFSILGEEHAAYYKEHGKVDLCLSVPALGRYRFNVFKHLGGVGAVIRVLPNEIKPLSKLGLPSHVEKLADLKQGLVLITGAAGSGKTTTLAALVDEINDRHQKHILTLEDPIEQVFTNKRSLVTQREIREHTESYAAGLRAALREDPDVVVVGELRDPETFSAALTAAETGHVVFGTLHTRSAHSTILRVIEQFPMQQRAHVQTMLANTLKAVVCQELVPTIDGQERVLASEVMFVNHAISNYIRENRTWQIPMVMQTNVSAGMRLMDDSLAELVSSKRVTIEEALNRATDKTKFVVPA